MQFEVQVAGLPVPQGSTRAFSRGGRIHTTNDPTGRIERWRGDIRTAVRDVAPAAPASDPVAMRMSFRMPRPAKHFLPATKSRPEPELRADAPHWVPSGADVDKLARAVLDALTGVIYVDDSQVVSIVAAKRYVAPGEGPGLLLELRLADNP